VAAVRSDFSVWVGFRLVRVQALLGEVPAGAWHRLSCGDGAKGPRVYDRALLRTNSPRPQEYARWLLIRRGVSDAADVAYFACGGLPATTLNDLVRVAGARWAIEDLFERAKGDCGLDEYEVRSRVGWHRHVTLSLFALAVVAVIRSRAVGKGGRKKGCPTDRADGARGAEAAAALRL
jgi:SRSO17 transposase